MSEVTSKLVDRFGHVTRFSDASSYDEKCVLCGQTDAGSGLQRTCPNKTAPGVTEHWVRVNYAFPKYEVQRNFAVEEPTHRWRPWSHDVADTAGWNHGPLPEDAVHAF